MRFSVSMTYLERETIFGSVVNDELWNCPGNFLLTTKSYDASTTQFHESTYEPMTEMCEPMATMIKTNHRVTDVEKDET